MMTEGEKMVWAATFVHTVGLAADCGGDCEEDSGNMTITSMAIKMARLQVQLLRKAAKAAREQDVEDIDPDWHEALMMTCEMVEGE